MFVDGAASFDKIAVVDEVDPALPAGPCTLSEVPDESRDRNREDGFMLTATRFMMISISSIAV